MLKKIKLVSLLSLAVIVVGLSSCSEPEPAKVDIYGESIYIPDMEGYVTVSKNEPKLLEFFKNFVPSTNILLEAYIEESDLNGLKSGDSSSLQSYATLQTADALIGGKFISDEDFQGIKGELSKNLDNLEDAYREDIDREIGNMNKRIQESYNVDSSVDVGETKSLKNILDTQNSQGVINISNVSGNGVSKKMLSSVTFIHMKNRIIYMYCYKVYKSDADIDDLEKRTEKFYNALLQANVASAL
ncbi:MAG: hypothetical protein PHX61_13165 [Alphaproteobacteria bacterium]|nr:hypothetical protein [Alphaproteobacteria bacterium]